MQSSPNDKASGDAAKIQAVEDENRDVANRTMPGARAALRPGTLPGPPLAPHSDEHRDQPVTPEGNLTTPLPGPETPE